MEIDQKLIDYDKEHVFQTNIHIVAKRYYDNNVNKYGNNINRELIIKILADMTHNGYWTFGILMSKKLEKIIDRILNHFIDEN